MQSCLTQCGASERTPVLQSLETFNATLQAEFVKALQLSTLANVAAHIDNITAGEHEQSGVGPGHTAGSSVSPVCRQAGHAHICSCLILLRSQASSVCWVASLWPCVPAVASDSGC